MWKWRWLITECNPGFILNENNIYLKCGINCKKCSDENERLMWDNNYYEEMKMIIETALV